MTGNDSQAHPRAERTQPGQDRTAVLRQHADELHRRTVATAGKIASTEDQLAATFDRLAEDQPARAEHLTALSKAARETAARERQWAADHSPD
jgi:hypothetical protein